MAQSMSIHTILLCLISMINAHCFNEIFDAIFVLSIPERIDFAAKVIHQFNQEYIDVILWNGYSDHTPKGFELYDSFRKQCMFDWHIWLMTIPQWIWASFEDSPFWNYRTL